MDPGIDQMLREGVSFRIRNRFRKVLKPQFYKNLSFSFVVSQKVWVGGLTDEVTWKKLQQLADTVGKSKWIEIIGKGQACVCYGTAEEAQTAIATLNGSFAGDIVVQFDVWTKKGYLRGT